MSQILLSEQTDHAVFFILQWYSNTLAQEREILETGVLQMASSLFKTSWSATLNISVEKRVHYTVTAAILVTGFGLVKST